MKQSSHVVYKLVHAMSNEEQIEFETVHQLSETKAVLLSQIYFSYKKGQSAHSTEKELKVHYGQSHIVIKATLKKLLIDFLLTKDKENGITTLSKKFTELSLYYNRKLYREAESLILEMEKFSDRIDLAWPLIPLNHFKYKLLPVIKAKNAENVRRKIINQNEHTLDRIRFNFDVTGLQEKIIGYIQKNLNYKSKEWQKKITEFEQNKLMNIKLDDKRFTFYTILAIEISKAAIAQAKCEHKVSFSHIRNGWIFLKKDFDFYLTNKRFEVVTIAYNLLSVAIATRDRKLIHFALIQIEPLIKSRKLTEEHLIIMLQKIKLEYVFLYSPNILEEVVKKHEHMLHSEYKNVDITEKRLYILMIATVFFKLKNYEKCNSYCDEVIDKFIQMDNRLDLKIEAEILKSMSMFSIVFTRGQFSQQSKSEFYNFYTKHYNSLRRNPNLKDRKTELLLVELFRKVKPNCTRQKMIEYVERVIQKIQDEDMNVDTDLIDVKSWLNELIDSNGDV